MKPKVYVETTVISYLVARPNRDIVLAAHQQITQDWWNTAAMAFDLVASELVLNEVSFGNNEMATERRLVLKSMQLLATTPTSVEL